ncbi:MAG: DegV family protein [Erysipelotrichaceae bacterium]|nr:DegV family protein [Erysipelotrichaceae bacterium]MDY5251712.1 DegV family protein [Erysipelotrichaceae bacterium]
MKKIAIMVDSGADITVGEAKEMGVYVVRMPVVVDGVEYIEEKEINDREMAKMMRNGAVAKTSQPLLGESIKMWEALLKDYDEVLFLPISSGISGTYQTSSRASEADEFKDKVFVVDSKFVCAPTKVLIGFIKQMIKAGYDSKMIKEKVEKEAELFAIIVPEDLVYLKRGGRISNAAAMLGNLLKIVPVLKVENGAIDVQTKVRTVSKAHQVAMETVADVENKDDYVWLMLSCDTDITNYKEQFAKICGCEVVTDSIKAVVMSHTGPGTFACGRVKKIKI